MNMKLPAVVTPPYLYHGCSTWKTFWEEKFTLGKFALVKIKKFGCRNVRKHLEIKNSEKYITLDISLKFVSLDNMKISSSEPEEFWEYQKRG